MFYFSQFSSIFQCNVTVNENLLVSYCVKPLKQHNKPECLQLTFTKIDGQLKHVILVEKSCCYPVELQKSEVKEILRNTDVWFIPENGSNGWKQQLVQF